VGKGDPKMVAVRAWRSRTQVLVLVGGPSRGRQIRGTGISDARLRASVHMAGLEEVNIRVLETRS
jgi:hypothetical protein